MLQVRSLYFLSPSVQSGGVDALRNKISILFLFTVTGGLHRPPRDSYPPWLC